VAPNRNYRHAGHFAATGLTGLTCAVCHLNKGTGETDHSTINLTVNTAAVVIPGVAASPSYSDGGQGVYNGSAAGTCTFVSCHGGKALQATALLYKWRNGGVISGDADCTRCHTVSSAPPATYAGPYIGPFSGYTSVINGGSQNLHQYHVGSQSLSCVVCHDKNKAHSRMLQGTRSIKVAGFAKPTLKTSFTYTVTSTTLNTSTCSNVGCHFDVTTRSWYKN
jgi:predicted CxxxxCH...CXXCH cytochrome family protein